MPFALFLLILLPTTKSSMTTIGVLPGVRGIAHDALPLKPPFNPQVCSLRLDRAGPTRALLAFQPHKQVLPQVKSQLDSVHGLGLGGCLACSRPPQLAMPGGMPASGRQPVKGAIACAVGASWPGTPGRGCSRACRASDRAGSALGACPFSQAGSSCRRRTSRPPLEQVFENFTSFEV